MLSASRPQGLGLGPLDSNPCRSHACELAQASLHQVPPEAPVDPPAQQVSPLPPPARDITDCFSLGHWSPAPPFSGLSPIFLEEQRLSLINLFLENFVIKLIFRRSQKVCLRKWGSGEGLKNLDGLHQQLIPRPGKIV